MDLQNWRRQILSPFKQMSLTSLFLQTSDEEEEDGMTFDPKHGLSACGYTFAQGYNRSGPPRPVIDLFLGLIGKDILVGKNSMMAQTFLKQFIKVEGTHSATNLKKSGWVHSIKRQWWS